MAAVINLRRIGVAQIKKMFQLSRGGILRGLVCSSHFSFTSLVWFSSSSSIYGRNEGNFMVDYLVDKLGFSIKEAVTASIEVSHSKSPIKPDSVIKFFEENGVEKAHMKILVSSIPTILTSDVDKTIKPKIRVLQDLGFHGHDLIKLMIRDNNYLRRGLYTCIIPAIETFKNYGLTNERIMMLLKDNPRKFMRKPGLIQILMNRVETEIGIPRHSRMFIHGIKVLASLNKNTIESRFKLFKSFGWSEDEILVMARKFPYCLMTSDQNLRNRLDYFLNELGFEPGYVAMNPHLLKVSMEKNILPRTAVFVSLKDRNLIGCNRSYAAAMSGSELVFRKTFVLRFKDQAPDVYEAYVKVMGSASAAAGGLELKF